MKFKRHLSAILLSISLFHTLAADDIIQFLQQQLQETAKKNTSDKTEEVTGFVQLLQNNAGFYYNYETDSLLYLDCEIRNGDGTNDFKGPVIIDARYEYNFSKNR